MAQLLLTLLMLTIVSVGGWYYWRFTLEAMLKVTRNQPRNLRFTIVDALCLVVLLQSVAAVPFVVTTPGAGWAFFLPVSIAWLVVLIGWLRSVSWLSQAGVRDVWRRAIFQLIVLPASFLLFVGMAAAACYMIGMIVFAARLSDLTHTLGVFVVGVVATLGVRGLCGWIVKGDQVFFEGVCPDSDEPTETSDDGGVAQR